MNSVDIRVSYSVHSTRGKPRLPHEIRQLGHGWVNTTTSALELWELITCDGFATSSVLEGDHRHSEHFVSRQVFMIDIDNGMTIDQLLENKTYNELAWGFYVTPSHTNEAHRFRIVFITETPVENFDDAILIFKQLTQMFPECDSVCKDATRIFYGTPDCEIKEILGNVITTDTVNWIIKRMSTPVQPTPKPQFNNDLIAKMPKKVTDLIQSMKPGDRSAKACRIGGIARHMTPELRHETELLLVAAGCDKTAIRSFRKYSQQNV